MFYLAFLFINCSLDSDLIIKQEESNHFSFGFDLYIRSNDKNDWTNTKIQKSKIQNIFYIGNKLEEIPEEIYHYKNVEKIFIISKNLSKISDKIGKLPKLKELTFGSYTLNEINSSIKNLINLKELSIFNDKSVRSILHDQNGRPIKTPQDEVRNLLFEEGEFLNLEKLEITIRNKIYKYDSIKEHNYDLMHEVNNCIDFLPEEIGLLKNLTILNINYQNITTLPTSIGNLNKLEKLFMNGNPLCFLPESFSKLKNLKELILTDHNLNEIPQSISNLSNLVSLILKRDNNFNDFIISDGNLNFDFSNLKNLSFLQLNGFKLHRIHKSILKIKKKNFKIILETENMYKDDYEDYNGLETFSKNFF